MQLSDILSPNAVKVLGGCSSKKRLFQEVGDLAAAAYGLDNELVIEALLDRETLGPTAVGRGISLPHARLAGLDAVHGVFIRLQKPVDCRAVDRKPIDLVFALLAPLDAGVEHLKALALVSRTLRDSDLCNKLRANDMDTALHALLTEAQAIKAA